MRLSGRNRRRGVSSLAGEKGAASGLCVWSRTLGLKQDLACGESEWEPMAGRYNQRFRFVMTAGRIALLVVLGFLLAVRPVQAKNDKLALAGSVVILAGVITAVVGGNPRQKADRERDEDYYSCYDNYGVNCYEKNYTDSFSGVAWNPNRRVIGVGLLLSAVGTFMLYKGLTGPSIVVAPQQGGASVMVNHGW